MRKAAQKKKKRTAKNNTQPSVHIHQTSGTANEAQLFVVCFFDSVIAQELFEPRTYFDDIVWPAYEKCLEEHQQDGNSVGKPLNYDSVVKVSGACCMVVHMLRVPEVSYINLFVTHCFVPGIS